MDKPKFPEKIDIWIVWCLRQASSTAYMRSVCTSRTMADYHRKAIERNELEGNNPVVRVWVEFSRANHLYGNIER